MCTGGAIKIVIKKGGASIGSLRSTALDYFLWGYVKSLVYADKPQTLDHLEDNIRRVIADIRPQMLEKVIENWTSRLDYIRASRGSPMPEIIFKIFLDCDIHFSYVWGHSGNLGNDRADQLAKEVTCQDMNHLMSVPWSHWNYVAWERTVSSWNTEFLAPFKALWTKSYTADFKLNAVEKANEVGNREAVRFFNVDESNIRLWRRNKTNFKNCDRRKRADRRGKPHWPELEAEINKWILKERDDGKAVSTVCIRMKARVIAREMNIVNFSGGPTWCYRFMKRNNLVVQRSDRNYLMTGKNNLTTF
ncbi:HTH CENPB-type domain-containing protein [Trichonephila clavipes]|nr:HTH CENPB-type domain-containing protein [Trichonephila clavipes]